ncbi:hypothetical protein HNQ93_000886 [Hymenobacter luteus]|uniref:Uncharacterized protein n=2 Tax=Hymenobacter TaxID=89966 RepID=A0A7W9WB77_9BACT|nr:MULTISPECIES: hypothetical protein [Hymenobacter]MBB4599634.1 hypothetical protein [Hymenobacter latericoloratus]MBB6058056.1 hypothetical protein [Hymenobacter luteus]
MKPSLSNLAQVLAAQRRAQPASARKKSSAVRPESAQPAPAASTKK